MKVLYLAREYPPHVYGGAGVHLEHLAPAMAALALVEVRHFGERPAREAGAGAAGADTAGVHAAGPEGNPRIVGYPHGDPMFDGNPDPAAAVLRVLHTDLRLVAQPIDADVVHCHTWYAHWAGLLAQIVHGVPLVITVHSLEPLRPWKREQLGRGYDLSSWIERTALERADAVIAVSQRDREEVLRRFDVERRRVHVIPNGVDAEAYRPVDGGAVLDELGIPRDRPFVLFLGRISRQKGILHFLRALERLSPEVAGVMVASSPDSEAFEREVAAEVERVRARGVDVTWVRQMLSRERAVALYSEAAVFCCPSVYEPFGIINLEAMACETPVVGTAVGGIRETVVHGETGLLVDVAPRSADDPEPADPDRLAAALAAAVARLLEAPDLRRRLGRAGRRRVIAHYTWPRIAARTLEVYRSLGRRGHSDLACNS